MLRWALNSVRVILKHFEGIVEYMEGDHKTV